MMKKIKNGLLSIYAYIDNKNIDGINAINSGGFLSKDIPMISGLFILTFYVCVFVFLFFFFVCFFFINKE